jgi:hypothetical protein
MADACAATGWFRKTAVYVWSESYSTAAFAAVEKIGTKAGRGPN